MNSNLTISLKPTTTFRSAPLQAPQKSDGFLGCCIEPSSAIWIVAVLALVTIFLIIFFCLMSVACRWIYKRRMKRKCAALLEKYHQDEKQRKADELNAKRLALQPILPYQPRNAYQETLDKIVLALNCKKTTEIEKQQSTTAFAGYPISRPQPPASNFDVEQKVKEQEEEERREKEKLRRKEVMKREAKEKKKRLRPGDGAPISSEANVSMENVQKMEGKMELKEEKTQPSNSPDFPYYKEGQRRQATAQPSNPFPSTTATTNIFRPSNVYELGGYLRYGIPITSGHDLTQKSVTSQSGVDGMRSPSPSGFNYLRVATRKSLKECLQSISYPEILSRNGEK